MLKKNPSINYLLRDIFYLNTYKGRALFIGILIGITTWFFWSDQKTGCMVTSSVFNQYSNSISRELELSNLKVAEANFAAFVKELNAFGVSSYLHFVPAAIIDEAEMNPNSECLNYFITSKVNIPLSFSNRVNGFISGRISYYPSLLAIMVLWIVAIFLVFTLRRVESKVRHKLERKLIGPIKLLSSGNSLGDCDALPLEVIDINANINLLKEKLILNEKTENELTRAKQLSELASQVSHDVRSPLSALNMVVGQLQNIPEAQRILIRNSVNRITDIANTLLQKSKEKIPLLPNSISTDSNLKLQIELLPALVDNLVSEKRIQFRDKIGIAIEASLEDSYGAFAKINSVELKRTISNLINNSCEALPDSKGKITVSIKKVDKEKVVQLIVRDNGKGIPKHILEKLGERGVTHGKEGTQSGSGIGVHHAKSTIESFGGKFEITSDEVTENHGTTITMTLPVATTPNWFVDKLILPPNCKVVCLDDDLAIHGIWSERLLSKKSQNDKIEHLTFTSGPEFKDWFKLNCTDTKQQSIICLVDYELLNQKQTGLDIIEELSIGKQAILVTSRYEENKIRERCDKLNVKLIPKAMAGFVPLVIEKPKVLMDGILLDDDEISHMTWSYIAKEQNKKFIGFKTPDDFFSRINEFDNTSPLFVDSNLGNGVKGEDVAKRAFNLGFSNIYLATGYDPSHFQPMPWLKSIVGKDPFPNLN